MNLIFPGSFDPVTAGHVDLILRSASMAEKLVVAVLDNPAKRYHFTLEQRMEMLRLAVAGQPHVEVACFSGLLADFCKQQQIFTVVRGLRGAMDYFYEQDMARANRKIGEIETLFLDANPDYAHISSSAVRDILHFHGDISKFVCQPVLEYIEKIDEPGSHR